MQSRIVCLLVLLSGAFNAAALTIRENTRFDGNIITNIGTAYATTGVFTVVPEASVAEPVPYWQLTNLLSSFSVSPAVQSIASGACDTNRIDILFSTNYLFSSVLVWQPVPTNQAVFVFTNSVLVDAFDLSGARAAQGLSLPITRFDRLGIAASNLNSVLEFCFQGRLQ